MILFLKFVLRSPTFISRCIPSGVRMGVIIDVSKNGFIGSVRRFIGKESAYRSVTGQSAVSVVIYNSVRSKSVAVRLVLSSNLNKFY